MLRLKIVALKLNIWVYMFNVALIHYVAGPFVCVCVCEWKKKKKSELVENNGYCAHARARDQHMSPLLNEFVQTEY